MHQHYDHIHLTKHLNPSRFLHNRYNDLLASDTVRYLGLSIISLFVPIFLLEAGYSLMVVIMVEFFLYLGSIVFHYFIILNIYKLRVKRALVLSNLFIILFYFTLYSSKQVVEIGGDALFLALIIILNILATTIYWTAHHLYVFKSARLKDTGKKVGLLLSLPVLVGIVSPLLGGALITYFNFRTVFLITIVLILTASCLLFFSSNIRIKKPNLNWKRVIDVKHPRKNTMYFMQGIGFSASVFIWPVFLFISSIKIISIGFLYLLSNFLYGLMCFYTGKQVDKNGVNYLMKIGAIGFGFSLAFRSLLLAITLIVFFQSMGGLFGAMYGVSMEADFYKCAHKDYYNGTMNRELYMHLGRIVLALVFLFSLYMLGVRQAFVVSLVFAGAAVALFSLFNKKSHSLVD